MLKFAYQDHDQHALAATLTELDYRTKTGLALTDRTTAKASRIDVCTRNVPYLSYLRQHVENTPAVACIGCSATKLIVFVSEC